MKNNNKNTIDSGTEGTYQTKEQGIERNNELINENNTSTTPNKNSSFSLKSAFSTLRRKKVKNKEVSTSDDTEDSKIKRDSMKERARILTPAEEISAINPTLKNVLNKIYSHEKYSIIEELSKSFDTETEATTKMAFQITLKSIMNSLNIFGENQDLLNTALNTVLLLSKHNMWDEVLVKNIEVDYETIEGEGDYDTIKDVYEIMKSCKEGEPYYINELSNYMDMSIVKPSFFAENTTNEKENEKAQQEELSVAPCSRLN